MEATLGTSFRKATLEEDVDRDGSTSRELRSIETKAQLLAALEGHLCDADRAAIDGDLAEYLLRAWKWVGWNP